MDPQSAALKLVRRGARHLRVLRNLSIGARLALGFTSIAALFLIANYYSRQNTTLVTKQVETSNRISRVLDRESHDLTDDLASLRRALREAIAVENSNAAQKLYAAIEIALNADVREYQQIDARGVRVLPANQLAASVSTLQTDATAMLTLAKRRDSALSQYWREFDQLDEKLTEPQQNVWRFGDRALTHSSTAALARALIAMRSAMTDYLVLPNRQHGIAVDLQEENFILALKSNSKALAAMKNEAWLQSIRSEFDRLHRLQRTVRTLRDRVQNDYGAVSSNIDQLLEVVHTNISNPSAQALLASAQLGSNIAYRADRNIVLLSVGALGLILIVSFLTARSVTSPVRRLMDATRKLAAGDDVSAIQRGGIRELDQLAAAFNDMSLQLAEAKRGVQEHQARLEERVVERTQRLQHLAYHDALTQLPNRRHLFKHLNSVLQEARNAGQLVALLLLDLDNFKTLNDSLGHLFGDRVLKAVSQRLREVVGDEGFAARLGGDEFTLVRPLRVNDEDVATQATKLLSIFQRPLRVDDREVIVGLSVGAAIFPDHASDPEALLRAADGALFRAKACGRNQTCIASSELVAEITAQFKTEQALRRAIQCDQLELLYQPQVQLTSGEVTSAEALLRWKRDGEYVLPLDFLSLAEQSGLIGEISDWALRRAMQTLASWLQNGWPTARAAINISAQQFTDRAFVAKLEKLLQNYSVPPSCVELELTETVLQTGADTLATLQRLREIGVGIALDDFGVGFSSLASLEQLPLSRVKIDRSLVENVDRNPRSASIARSIISLCRSLNLKVTAEGVERIEQLRFLQACEEVEIQGFLLARPMTVEALTSTIGRLPTTLSSLLNDADRNRQTSSSIAYLPRRGAPRT